MGFKKFKRTIFDLSMGLCIGACIGLMFLIMVLF